MAENICSVNTANVGRFSKPEVGFAKLKNLSLCAFQKATGQKNSDIPIFAPEGKEGAQNYVDANFSGCKAVSDGFIASIYKVDCSKK